MAAQTEHFSIDVDGCCVKAEWKWFVKEDTATKLFVVAAWATQREFKKRLQLPQLIIMKKREQSGTVSGEQCRSTTVSNFYEMYVRLDVLPVAHFSVSFSAEMKITFDPVW